MGKSFTGMVFASLAGVTLVALTGCSGKGTPGGGTNPGKGVDLTGPGEGKFALDPPNLSTHLKQGETKEVTIGISRGTNFDKDVGLKFEDVPKGVTFDPATPKIKHGDKNASFKVKAADDAAIGDFKVKVLGHPTAGAEAEDGLKITVKKK